jgi:hypothetical protein
MKRVHKQSRLVGCAAIGTFTFVALGGLFTAGTASAGTPITLYTTDTDFSQWGGANGATAAGSTTYDADGSSVNGLGNNGNPNVAGTPGSLQVNWTPTVGGFNGVAFSPNEEGNTAFLNLLAPGSVPTTFPPPTFSAVPGSIAAGSGTILMTYTFPDNNGGNFFDPGIIFNYNNNFDQDLPTGFTSDGTVDGLSTETVSIPYTLNATSGLSFFQMGILYNSNFSPTGPFFVDNIQIAQVPEPPSIGLIGLLATGLLGRRRRS